MKAILDTNLLVAESLSHPRYDVAVSSLTWAELGYGIRKATSAIERARREVRVARLRALLGAGLPFDDSAATAYEAVCGLVLAQGREGYRSDDCRHRCSERRLAKLDAILIAGNPSTASAQP